MSDSVRPHRQQPTRLPRPWDSPGKNTGVGCHFLLQWWKWKVKVKPLSPVRLTTTPGTAAPGSSIHGIFQARVLEWGAIAFSVNTFEIHLKGRCDRQTWLWFLNEQSFASLPFFFFFFTYPSFPRGFKYLLLPYTNFLYTQVLFLCILSFPVNFSVSKFFHVTTSLF